MLFDKIIAVGKTENRFKMKWQVSNWNTKTQMFSKSKRTIIDAVGINCDLIII